MKIGTDYYWYHNDHLGTPQKITTTSGAVVWSAKHTSFGDAQVEAASTTSSNLRFAGQYYDQETGLHYNYHRYYDPKIGRYLIADPIGLAGGINPYAYVQNNPVNLIDPQGLISLKNLMRNARFRAVASFGAAVLAEYAASRMGPGKARGSVYAASSALAFFSANASLRVGVASYVAAFTTAETGVGLVGGVATGTVAFGLMTYDIYLVNEYMQNALEDFGFGKPIDDSVYENECE
jgi:RHS repeat-associated protein